MTSRHALRSLIAAIALLAAAALSPAAAEQRLALVIGNTAYKSVVALPNATNDARAMNRLLGEAGFEVTVALDQTQADMRKSIGDFVAKMKAKGPDAVAAVFYAGHGLQIDGENFLVPVDLDPVLEADLTMQAVRFNDLLNALASVPSKMRIVMVDACRSNPFPELKGSMGRGLALVDAKSGQTDSFLAYSTSPGAEAEDGSGSNSPYTGALIEAAREPGLSIEDAFKRVRVKVTEATDGRQIPWESSSLTTAFRFFSGEQKKAELPPLVGEKRSREEWRTALQGRQPGEAFALAVADDTVPAYEAYVALFTAEPYALRARVILDRRREMLAWNEALNANTGAAYQAFLARFPDSDLAPTARRLEARTRNRQTPAAAVAAVAPPPAGLQPQPACSCSPLKQGPQQNEPKPKAKADRRATQVKETLAPRRSAAPTPPGAGGGGYGYGGR